MKSAGLLSVFFLFVFVAPASAACQLTNDGHEICRDGARVSTPRHVSKQGAANCPRVLGCGCNLANRLGGIERFGRKAWRDLWVARNWAQVGRRARQGCTNCVAVLRRGRRGGHVGVVKDYDANGNPVIWSYANARRGWTTATYPKRRVITYRRL